MKKIRIMLAAVAAIAIVGGALAFKASNMYTVDYCTTPTTGSTCPASLTCPTFADDQLTPGSGGTVVCTTTPRNTSTPEHLCLAVTDSNPVVTKNCSTAAPIRIQDEPAD